MRDYMALVYILYLTTAEIGVDKYEQFVSTKCFEQIIKDCILWWF